MVVYDVDLPGSKPEVVDEFMIPFSQSSETSIYSLVRGIGNRPFNSSRYDGAWGRGNSSLSGFVKYRLICVPV